MTHDENALRAALTAATASVDPGADVVRRARDGGRRRLRRHRVQVGAASVLTAAAVVSGVVPLLGGGSGTSTVAPPEPAASVPSDLPTGVGADCEHQPGYGYQITPADLPDEVRLLWHDERLDVDQAWPRMETGPCSRGEVSVAGVDADGVIVRLATVTGPEPAGIVPAGTAPGTLVPGPEDDEAGRRDLAWLLPDGQQLRVDADGFTDAELAELAATATLTDGAVDLGDWPAAVGLDYAGEPSPARSTQYTWEVSGPQGSLTVQTAASGSIYGWGLTGDRIVDFGGRPAVLRGPEHLVWSPADGVMATLIVAEGLDPLEVAATVGPVPADDPRLAGADAPTLEETGTAEPEETGTAEPEETATPTS
ncbi:hypothetical protein [Jiangella anatolica]|uniref:Uncharacterized protein n=1 Tax=Jiangella anatolica TaxID=2670374 RepID=A0A2W2BW17_9ACTN|nr:hypothetical protein [Jiangella anatolica]PZF84614.1 hypothetical protein C1I92_08210 [Jiangella anatolica]